MENNTHPHAINTRLYAVALERLRLESNWEETIEREELQNGDVYYIWGSEEGSKELSMKFVWEGSERDKYFLHNGDIHLRKEMAEARTLAVILARIPELARNTERYWWLKDNKHLDLWRRVQGSEDRCENIDENIDKAMGNREGNNE